MCSPYFEVGGEGILKNLRNKHPRMTKDITRRKWSLDSEPRFKQTLKYESKKVQRK